MKERKEEERGMRARRGNREAYSFLGLLRIVHEDYRTKCEDGGAR
jgi:hypothetical protein